MPAIGAAGTRTDEGGGATCPVGAQEAAARARAPSAIKRPVVELLPIAIALTVRASSRVSPPGRRNRLRAVPSPRRPPTRSRPSRPHVAKAPPHCPSRLLARAPYQASPTG